MTSLCVLFFCRLRNERGRKCVSHTLPEGTRSKDRGERSVFCFAKLA